MHAKFHKPTWDNGFRNWFCVNRTGFEGFSAVAREPKSSIEKSSILEVTDRQTDRQTETNTIPSPLARVTRSWSSRSPAFSVVWGIDLYNMKNELLNVFKSRTQKYMYRWSVGRKDGARFHVPRLPITELLNRMEDKKREQHSVERIPPPGWTVYDLCPTH